MTHISKLNIDRNHEEHVDPFSPSVSSEEENLRQKDLWADASTFYGLPEDVCDFEDVETEEDDISNTIPFLSQKWSTSRV